ncbi:MAG: transposase [Elusimicrobia bacterium CG1_02_37_114]|nr:MAG: transposase [Elusimicrobia bacterium CG1_02_37_114]PIV53714.1 MAG: transposase [Elusimicrobia bacterium CG02_land_8_20_14_3_00_37_13]
MARMARVVAPNIPHHIVQRGNRSQKVFFKEHDKKLYIEILIRAAKDYDVSFWAYCLMDNHVHLIAVPQDVTGLAKCIGETHKKYTRIINLRENWKGYLWQGRFLSYPLDKRYLYSAMRYIELNPVRAGIVQKAEDYPWSSAREHIYKEKSLLLSDNFMLSEIKDWAGYLAEGNSDKDLNAFRKLSRTGRPLGDEDFVQKIETLTGRVLKKNKPGPKA